jgi:hypothetical protein
MRLLILIIFLGTIGQCYAGTFDMDTIDNWQIYNGADLVLGGHDSQLGTVFQGIIKRAELKDLAIQYNHDVIEDSFVVVDIMDDQGNILLAANFKARLGIRFAFRKKELERLTNNSITIRYREKRENGTDKILGRIRFV